MFDPLSVRRAPFLARGNYYREMQHMLLWGLVAGLVEGNFAAVVVAKTFAGSALLINIAATTPVAAHITSLFWGTLCVGRPKKRIFLLCSTGTALLTASLGVTPAGPWGGWLFVLQIALAQFFMTGVVTLRSALWRSNYPQSCRGQITARLQMVRMVARMVAVAGAAALFDWDPQAYRVVFPAVGLLGVLAVLPAGRMRIRGERLELDRGRAAGVSGDVDTRVTEPFSLIAVLSPGPVLGNAVRVLRQDRRFRRYLTAQMIAGCANLLVRSVTVTLITCHLLVDMTLEYLISGVLLELLPLLVILGTMGRFGRYFDRVGVLGFRVAQGVCWVITMLLGTLGALTVVHGEALGPAHVPVGVMLFAAHALMMGVCLGGGSISWNLGHLHFAQPHEAEIYMGIHVSLTGLRGLVMPTVGTILWATVGWGVWLVSVVLALLALVSFWLLAREERREDAAAAAAATVARQPAAPA